MQAPPTVGMLEAARPFPHNLCFCQHFRSEPHKTLTRGGGAMAHGPFWQDNGRLYALGREVESVNTT